MKTNSFDFSSDFVNRYLFDSPLKNDFSRAAELCSDPGQIRELESLLPLFFGDYQKKNGFPFYPDGAYPREFFKKLCENAQHFNVCIDLYAFAAYSAIFVDIKNYYKEFGISGDIFESTASSLAVYAKSHTVLTNKAGISDYRWCANYLCLAVFRIGELEYQLCVNPFEKGMIPEEFDTVIKIHVPGGCDFSPQARKKSYKMAYDFFSCKLSEKKLCFVCDSWLLSKEHSQIPGNISSFRNEFTIISEYADNEKDFLWRVFGTRQLDNVSTLPAETAMQRFYIRKLENNTLFYSSAGYFVIENTEDLWKK